jgi:hypothetical protein
MNLLMRILNYGGRVKPLYTRCASAKGAWCASKVPLSNRASATPLGGRQAYVRGGIVFVGAFPRRGGAYMHVYSTIIAFYYS